MKKSYVFLLINIILSIIAILLEEISYKSLSRVANAFNLSKGGSYNQTLINYYFLFNNIAVYVFELGIIFLIIISLVNIYLRNFSKKKGYFDKDNGTLSNIFLFNIFFPLLALINHGINYGQVKMFIISRYWLSAFYVERNLITYIAGDPYIFYKNNRRFYLYLLLIVNIFYLAYLLIKEFDVMNKINKKLKDKLAELI